MSKKKTDEKKPMLVAKVGGDTTLSSETKLDMIMKKKSIYASFYERLLGYKFSNEDVERCRQYMILFGELMGQSPRSALHNTMNIMGVYDLQEVDFEGMPED